VLCLCLVDCDMGVLLCACAIACLYVSVYACGLVGGGGSMGVGAIFQFSNAISGQFS
jgi:hypothetical protein